MVSNTIALKQPQTRRDSCGDEQQNDEHVLKLRKKLFPRRRWLFRRQLVFAITFKPLPRLRFAQGAARIRVERSQHFINALLICVRSFALDFRGGPPAPLESSATV